LLDRYYSRRQTAYLLFFTAKMHPLTQSWAESILFIIQ
jgi:hypothetical protein